MAHNDDKPTDWSVSEARRRFSELITAAAREPQPLYNRGQMVAAVIDADELRAFRAWKAGHTGRTLAAAFDELRAICREERYELQLVARADRPNPFADDATR